MSLMILPQTETKKVDRSYLKTNPSKFLIGRIGVIGSFKNGSEGFFIFEGIGEELDFSFF